MNYNPTNKNFTIFHQELPNLSFNKLYHRLIESNWGVGERTLHKMISHTLKGSPPTKYTQRFLDFLLLLLLSPLLFSSLKTLTFFLKAWTEYDHLSPQLVNQKLNKVWVRERSKHPLKIRIGLSLVQHPNFQKPYIPYMTLKVSKLGGVGMIYPRTFYPYK